MSRQSSPVGYVMNHKLEIMSDHTLAVSMNRMTVPTEQTYVRVPVAYSLAQLHADATLRRNSHQMQAIEILSGHGGVRRASITVTA